ncbi:MAG TPA: TlpA disulfide reductase family protein [Allosphingosinicella sp.]|jgi:thiol-disulfide isomerase/thioredoxin
MRSVLLLSLLLSACSAAPEQSKEAAPERRAASGPAEPPPAAIPDRSRAGRAAPETAFEDPDGAPATLADFRGRPVLVNLWATWCAPCIAEMPTLDRLAAREAGRLEVLTISQDLDGREKIEAFFAKQGYRNLETWLDPRMALTTKLEADRLPTTILYDAQGREVWRVAGPEDWESGPAAVLISEGLDRAAAPAGPASSR